MTRLGATVDDILTLLVLAWVLLDTLLIAFTDYEPSNGTVFLLVALMWAQTVDRGRR